VGARIAEEGVAYTHVFTSPLVRATQTAEILVAESSFEECIAVWAPLAGGTTAEAASLLEGLDAEATVLVVGHEPLIRAVAAHLSGMPGLPGFRTGAACLVELGLEGGRFRWIVDPDTLLLVEQV